MQVDKFIRKLDNDVKRLETELTRETAGQVTTPSTNRKSMESWGFFILFNNFTPVRATSFG